MERNCDICIFTAAPWTKIVHANPSHVTLEVCYKSITHSSVERILQNNDVYRKIHYNVDSITEN